jgi:RNA polymerase sigma-70 factor (ECF subfamily)
MTHVDLTAEFEASRPRLQAVAYRMLGSFTEAEDAVQETWIRLSRSDPASIDNLGGWLTTVLARVSLGMLRSRHARPESTLEHDEPEPQGAGPDDEAVLVDTLGAALIVVLDTLAPAERLAFVLHDLFAVPFDDIAPILDRSPAAARQLASRARRRVQTSSEPQSEGGQRQHEIVGAFLAASRRGDFAALVALLDPDAVLRADRAAVNAAARNRDRGAPHLEPELRGADAVARTLVGSMQVAQPALIEDTPGAVWATGGKPRAVFAFHVIGDTIAEIEIVTDPATVRSLRVELLEPEG